MRKLVNHIIGLAFLMLPFTGWAYDFDFTETRDYLDGRLSMLNQSWVVQQGTQGQIEPAEVFLGGDLPKIDLFQEKLDSIAGPFQGWGDAEAVRQVVQYLIRERQSNTGILLGAGMIQRNFIVQGMVEEGLPLQIAYLPGALSGFYPFAQSDDGRLGLWQLPLQAGLRYGLACSEHHDERRDPALSSRAASRQIRELFMRYGNWDQAILAYLAGPGKLTQAFLRANSVEIKDLLDHLPTEVRAQWIVFQALNYIGYEERNLPLHPVSLRFPAGERIKMQITKPVKLGHLADLLQVDIGSLEWMNPAVVEEVTGNTRDSHVVIPANKKEAFVALGDRIYLPEPTVVVAKTKTIPKSKAPETKSRTVVPTDKSAIVYHIRPGDNLGSIARVHGVSVQELRSWNGIQGNMIRAGATLKIYPDAPEVSKPITESQFPSTKKVTTYTVRSGDTLWEISMRYEGVSADDIMSLNKINEDIHPGQVLKIPLPENQP